MNNRIRILVTGDLHGTVSPYDYRDHKETCKGLARLASLITSLRDENTLLIDNGDCLTGSPLSLWHALNEPEEEHPMTTVMKALEYDYVNLGNHDFDIGEEALAAHLEKTGASCLTSNVTYRGEALGPTYAIEEIAGKKIALFAITTHYTRFNIKRSLIRHIRFQDALETARKTVSLIKDLEKPDYIIGIYHGGFERDLINGYQTGSQNGENQAYSILQEITGIDLLITGHQHRSLTGTMNNTVYTQIAPQGQELACIDIFTDTGVIEPHLLKADTPADDSITALIQDKEDACSAWLDESLARTAMDLTFNDPLFDRLRKPQAATLINRLQKELTGADLSACALSGTATGFGKNITMRDLVLSVPFPENLSVRKITGAQLRQYLEQTAVFWSIRNDTIVISPYVMEPVPALHRWIMVDGVTYTVRVSDDPGDRIRDLQYNGEDVTDDMEFTIAMNRSCLINGFIDYTLREMPSVRELPGNIISLLADQLKEAETVSFEPEYNITVIK